MLLSCNQLMVTAAAVQLLAVRSYGDSRVFPSRTRGHIQLARITVSTATKSRPVQVKTNSKMIKTSQDHQSHHAHFLSFSLCFLVSCPRYQWVESLYRFAFLEDDEAREAIQSMVRSLEDQPGWDWRALGIGHAFAFTVTSFTVTIFTVINIYIYIYISMHFIVPVFNPWSW